MDSSVRHNSTIGHEVQIDESMQTSLQLLRSARDHTISIVDSLSQDKLNYSSRSGSWSVGEVVDHVLLAEKFGRGELARLIDLRRKGLRPVVERRFSDVNVSIFFVPRSVIPVFTVPLSLMMTFCPTFVRDVFARFPLIPIQHPDLTKPRKGLPAAELRHRLRASIAETEELILANAALDFRSMVHRHPLLGTNTAPELVKYLAYHEGRHHSQIQRVMKSAGFPGEA